MPRKKKSLINLEESLKITEEDQRQLNLQKLLSSQQHLLEAQKTLMETNKILMRINDSLFKKEEENKNKIDSYCNLCPNRFECILMKYDHKYRAAACLLYDQPISYSSHLNNSKKPVIIPETTDEWESRLKDFLQSHEQ